jgi:hypothetical protein
MEKRLNLKNSIIIVELALALIIVLSSCKKFVDAGSPITSLNSANVFKNDASAASVLTAIYIKLSNSRLDASGPSSISLKAGLSADELELSSDNANLLPYFNNSLTSGSSDVWVSFYQVVFSCNLAIEQLNASSTLTPTIKQQLIGEAVFIRAYCYFYLVNLYGAVPLALTSDYKINSTLARTTENVIYQQVINDLKEAQSKLSSKYVGSDGTTATSERTRPTKWAASALLSRVYLYTKDYSNAITQSSDIISNASMYGLASINDLFLKNSKEAIWQLQPVGIGTENNTIEGNFFIPLTLNNLKTSLTDHFITSFDPNDQRKAKWTGAILDGSTVHYYPLKYKIGTINSADLEYSMILRLGEQYLIRAESQIQLNNISDGIADLNIIRKRATDLTAPVSDQLSQLSSGLTKAEALTAVENERIHELFTEWGHRWLDLKRTERANATLAFQKGVNWQSTDQLYPIPQYDLDKDLNLVQNPGY